MRWKYQPYLFFNHRFQRNRFGKGMLNIYLDELRASTFLTLVFWQPIGTYVNPWRYFKALKRFQRPRFHFPSSLLFIACSTFILIKLSLSNICICSISTLSKYKRIQKVCVLRLKNMPRLGSAIFFSSIIGIPYFFYITVIWWCFKPFPDKILSIWNKSMDYTKNW